MSSPSAAAAVPEPDAPPPPPPPPPPQAPAKPAWGGWGAGAGAAKPAARAAPSLAELMDEQLAERLQSEGQGGAGGAGGGAAQLPSSGGGGGGLIDEALDPDLALALALSLSTTDAPAPPPPQDQEKEEKGAPPTAVEEEEEDADLALARRLQAEEDARARGTATETGGTGSDAGSGEVDADLALAMLLQEEERRLLAAAQDKHARRRLQESQGQYTKVQVAFRHAGSASPAFAEAAPNGGVGGGGQRVEEGQRPQRVLLSAQDAGGAAQQQEEDEDEEEDLTGLAGILTAAGGRRRRKGELLKTAQGDVISKHDAGVNGRLNALDLAARYQGVGDLEGERDLRIPNRAFNALRQAMKKHQGTLKGVATRGKVEASARATQEGVLDARTRLILFKMINQGTLFTEVGGVVKTGKESNVYFAPSVSSSLAASSFAIGAGDANVPVPSHDEPEEEAAAAAAVRASSLFSGGRRGGSGGGGSQAGAGAAEVVDLTGDDDDEEEEEEDEEDETGAGRGRGAHAPVPVPLPDGCAIKLFKTTLNEFSNRATYIDGDPRYGSLLFNRQSTRQKFQLWAEKEYRNLVRMRRAGIPCPAPLAQKDHVLVMSFLGVDGWPSPQLREVKLSDRGWRACYRQVVRLVRDLYQKASLVHGDLSEYNILYHQLQPHLIDVGQAVHTSHKLAERFLLSDLEHVRAFFARMGVHPVVADDKALLSFVRMTRWDADDEAEEEEAGEDEEEGQGQPEEEDEDDNDDEELVGDILERLIGGEPFEAAVRGTGFWDQGGRHGYYKNDAEENQGERGTATSTTAGEQEQEQEQEQRGGSGDEEGGDEERAT